MSLRLIRQVRASLWVKDNFGEERAENVAEQATRLLEEALEAAQAAGVPTSMANKLLYRVYGKPVGELKQEIGQVGLCLLTLASSAGINADDEEAFEVARALATAAEDPGYFPARYAKKIAAGVTIE